MKPLIRVAIVDDSRFIRKALSRLLADHPKLKIVGCAETGEELLANLEKWRPHVITLDLNMPGIGGLVTLERIMSTRPTPVIILSTHSGEGAPLTLEALSRGAADFVDKEAYSLIDFQKLREVLAEKILHLSGASGAVVAAPVSHTEGATSPVPSAPPVDAVHGTAIDLVLIGASTGGPGAIERILADLGPHFSVPIAIVQHMPPGFTAAFAERLDRQSPLAVREAADRDPLAAGIVSIAPAGWHMRLAGTRSGLRVTLHEEPVDVPHRPSVDALFESGADVLGERALAILLTGMGRDGAYGMAAVANAGGHTIAQHAHTCVVYGMPRAAVALDAAREILPLHRIGGRVAEFIGSNRPAGLPRG